MQLLQKGYGVQHERWHVTEEIGAGYCRVYYLVGGPVLYRDSNRSCTLTKGHLYVLPSHAPFSVIHDPSDPMCCLHYHFDFFPSMLNTVAEIPVDDNLKRILDVLMDCHQSGCTETGFYSHLVEALFCLIRDSGVLDSQDPALTEMLQAIRRCYKDPSFSVAKVSRELGYSVEHFIRLFRRYLHTTPYQYVLDMRLGDAARMLAGGNTTVSEVSKAVGYSDSKVFTRAFTRKFGVSPSQYQHSNHPIA